MWQVLIPLEFLLLGPLTDNIRKIVITFGMLPTLCNLFTKSGMDTLFHRNMDSILQKFIGIDFSS